MVFFAAVLVTRKKGHLWIDNLVNILPVSVAKTVKVISVLLQILFFLLVIWGTYKLYPTSSRNVSPANSIPMSVVYMCLPLSSALCILYSIRDLVEIFIERRGDR